MGNKINIQPKVRPEKPAVEPVMQFYYLTVTLVGYQQYMIRQKEGIVFAECDSECFQDHRFPNGRTVTSAGGQFQFEV
jgi:hypothetical protein